MPELPAYRVHGVAVDFPGEVPYWSRRGDAGAAWQVRLAVADAATTDRVRPGPAQWSWQGIGAADQLTILDISGGPAPGSAIRFAIDWAARTVLVTSAGAASYDGTVLLLGAWVLPMISRRELGTLSLHAAAVTLAGRTVAICGASGSGKSTATAALLAAGGTLVTDEPALVDLSSRPALWPGLQRIRLQPETARHPAFGNLGERVEQLDGKQGLVPARRSDSREPAGLDAIWVLADRLPATAEPGLTRLRGGEAVRRLMAQRFDRLPDPVRNRHEFTACAAITGQVPVFQAELPEDLDRLPGLLSDLICGGRG